MRRFLWILSLAQVFSLEPRLLAQKYTSEDRYFAEDMLKTIARDVRDHYYDPKFHGLNWDALVTEAREKIDQSDSLDSDLSTISGLLDKLNDSHSYLIPPSHGPYEYGWEAKMVGPHCYVTRVDPVTDAGVKGLRAGDELLAINGRVPTRENFMQLEYTYRTLRPQTKLSLRLRDQSGVERTIEVATTIQKHPVYLYKFGTPQQMFPVRYIELPGVMILRLPIFEFSFSEMGSIISKACNYPSLIVDLRGNPGGTADALEYMIGSVFSKETKIGDRKGRSATQPLVVKPRRKVFTGNLVVLVDSTSGSGAEVFARVVQLERRGVVIGDQTSGRVMEAHTYYYPSYSELQYGASITTADLIMTDHQSLEHTGMTPDRLLLPTPEDLAAGRDPVLARAAETLGARLSAEAAGKMFPYHPPI
jgi:C-terminal processing protease CtpA/Prc